MENTSPAIIAERFEAQRQAFLKEPCPTPEARLSRLDRLLALNHQRYAEEVAQGLHSKKGKK